MGFGFFKKLKDGFNKIRKFINNKIIQPTIDLSKKVKPILREAQLRLEKIDINKFKPLVPPKHQTKLDKLDDLRKKTIEISDDVINLDDKLKNNDVSGAIEYAGHKFIPRLKRK